MVLERLRPVAIVTDGAADLPPRQDLERMFGFSTDIRLEIVSLGVTIDGVNFETIESLLKRINQGVGEGHWPTTSLPSVGSFVDVYEKLIKDNYDVVSIHVGDGLSGTLNSARLAAENFDPERISIYNSRTVSMAQGLMVIEAGKMAASGFRQLEIAKNMEEVKKKISGRAITPNIDYLEKGGRVKNRAELSFGKLLKINPIVDIDHNEAVAIEKIPGKKLAMSWLMKNFIGEQNLERVVVLDFEARETTDEFIQRLIKNEIPEDIIYRGKLGPVTGAHGGPGTWAVIIEKRVA